jgi:hypothetical protein
MLLASSKVRKEICDKNNKLRVEVLTAVIMKIIINVFWDVAPRILVGIT